MSLATVVRWSFGVGIANVPTHHERRCWAVRKFLQLPSCTFERGFDGLTEATQLACVRPADIWFMTGDDFPYHFTVEGLAELASNLITEQGDPYGMARILGDEYCLSTVAAPHGHPSAGGGVCCRLPEGRGTRRSRRQCRVAARQLSSIGRVDGVLVRATQPPHPAWQRSARMTYPWARYAQPTQSDSPVMLRMPVATPTAVRSVRRTRVASVSRPLGGSRRSDLTSLRLLDW